MALHGHHLKQFGGDKVKAEEINTLKSKIKTEFNRRNGYGSLVNYTSSDYDFTVTPTAGGTILEEHGKKTVDILLAVKDVGDLHFTIAGETIPTSFNNQLNAYVDSLAAEPSTNGTSSCRGACTGLCLGTCHTSCNGCSGTCSGCTGCTGVSK